jgi:hypothetical protein
MENKIKPSRTFLEGYSHAIKGGRTLFGDADVATKKRFPGKFVDVRTKRIEESGGKMEKQLVRQIIVNKGNVYVVDVRSDAKNKDVFNFLRDDNLFATVLYGENGEVFDNNQLFVPQDKPMQAVTDNDDPHLRMDLDMNKKEVMRRRRRGPVCEYPGRDCTVEDVSAYGDKEICSRRCRASAPVVKDSADGSRNDVALSVKYPYDVPLLTTMVKVYSNYRDEDRSMWRSWLRFDPKLEKVGMWPLQKMRPAKDGAMEIAAAVRIPKGTRFLVAPAAIVRGSLDLLDVILTLPALLLKLEGLTQLKQRRNGAVTETSLKKFRDLFPLDAIVLGETVQRNAVQLPLPETYAVSVLFSLLPHSCTPNAAAVVGHYPVHTLVGSSRMESRTKEYVGPAVAVYALKDIEENELISLGYGLCSSVSKTGFACTASEERADCLGDPRNPIPTVEEVTDGADSEFYSNKSANVFAPDRHDENALVNSIRDVINAVQVPEENISTETARTLLNMWLRN